MSDEKGAITRWNIGDAVFVTADNYGSPAVVVAIREGNSTPQSQYKVRTDHDEFWAFDFEVAPMTYDSTADTKDHMGKVQSRMFLVRQKLLNRALLHDASKLEEPEKTGYDQLVVDLKDVVYGTDEYRAALAAAKPVIDHHYQVNTHHPEHYPNGIAGMSLLDVVEMLCDWKAASERTKQGSIAQSLAHNKERFGISDQLASILENTVKELNW